MGNYNIPKSVKISFDIKTIPELTHRIYRIIWVSISIGHLRDQYFQKNVARLVRAIKKHNPQKFEDFFTLIGPSGLGRYGCKWNREYKYSRIDKDWWLQVWNLIKNNGDIELINEWR